MRMDIPRTSSAAQNPILRAIHRAAAESAAAVTETDARTSVSSKLPEHPLFQDLRNFASAATRA